MNNLQFKNRNVYWFLIDGLSPLHLRICGNMNVENTFFDELMKNGTVFSNVASTAAGTHTAMHSVFSSMYPSINGATGWVLDALRKFNPDIFTLTDFFKEAGYKTFRYGDADKERNVPMSGFDVWETSNYPLSMYLKETDEGETFRRQKFIKRVNECKGPKFIYHHSLFLHEINGLLGEKWLTKEYENNIAKAAENFKILFSQYEIGEEDIVILSSDHGVVLDIDWMDDGSKFGDRHYEHSVITFFAILNKQMNKQVLPQLISALDEAPTIAKLVLGVNMPGQGIERCPLIFDGEYKQKVLFREKGTYSNLELQNPYTSDLFYLRDGNWKYIYGISDSRCEWLIDLDKDGDYKKNLVGDRIDLVRKYRSMLEDKLINPEDSMDSIYAQAKFTYKKSDLQVRFSIIIEESKLSDEIYASLVDMAGPYKELVILGNGNKYTRTGVRYINKKMEMLSKEDIRGEYVVYIKEATVFSEYMISDLNLEIEDCTEKDSMFCFELGEAYRAERIGDVSNLKVRTINIRVINMNKDADVSPRCKNFHRYLINFFKRYFK